MSWNSADLKRQGNNINTLLFLVGIMLELRVPCTVVVLYALQPMMMLLHMTKNCTTTVQGTRSSYQKLEQ